MMTTIAITMTTITVTMTMRTAMTIDEEVLAQHAESRPTSREMVGGHHDVRATVACGTDVRRPQTLIFDATVSAAETD